MEKPGKKSELTALKIEKAILQGEYSPGDRLPPERVLAERYGVSRSILREAMKHMASLGLVCTEAQSGTYVTDYSREASLELLIYLLDNNETMDPYILRSLIDFRELLETGAAERAAGVSDAGFITTLRQRLKELAESRGTPATLAARDYEFHAAVIDRTGNIAFRLLFNACRPVYLFYAEEFYRVPGHHEHTLGQLEDLITALDARDGRRASEAMRSALTYGRESIYQSLQIQKSDTLGGSHGTGT